jgi:hypothetical protein
LISKANDQKQNVEKLDKEGKLNRKSIILTARINEFIKMKSIGDIVVDDIKSDVAYVKENEKQAQIIELLTSRTKDRMNLKLLQEIDITVGDPSNIISGCTILDNGKVLFSEYNLNEYIDRATLNDSNGNFIRTVQVVDSADGPFHDITSIDKNTIAVYIGSYISIVNIDTQNMLRKFENTHHCYGITDCDSKLYYCHRKE